MRLGAIVLDSDDIEALADFYARLLGWTKSSQNHDGEKWITVIKPDYSETPLVFQENPDYKKTSLAIFQNRATANGSFGFLCESR